MSLLRLLLIVVAFAGGLAAQGGSEAQTHGQEPAKPTLEMENKDFFITQYKHLNPHKLFEVPVSTDPEKAKWFFFFDVNLFQLIALALILLFFIPVKQSFAQGRTHPLTRVFRGWVQWIRDEMVYAVMGKEHGARFLPYFCYLFAFLAFMNLAGLVPGSVTATATPFVTGAMAVITLVMMIGGGIREQGFVKFFVNLLPHGLPVALIPLMALVELIGLVVKPFALTIRLFANMLAGHLVIYSFVGLIFLFAKMMQLNGFHWLTALPAVGMAVFIYIIEAFVVLLQAYIFTYLSIIFVQLSLHPEH